MEGDEKEKKEDDLGDFQTVDEVSNRGVLDLFVNLTSSVGNRRREK